MGQLSNKICTQPDSRISCETLDEYSESVIRESKITILGSFSNGRQGSVKSLCKELGLGKYLAGDQNKVNRCWKEMIDIARILNDLHSPQHSESLDFYLTRRDRNGTIICQQSPMKEKSRETDLQGLKTKYPFIINKNDQQMVQVFIIDKQGFKYLVSLGPPGELRWSCWKVLLLAKRNPYKSYEDMLSSSDQKQELIQLDIKRTLVSHPFFQNNHGDQSFGQQQLLRMLSAIVQAFPQLGYCQGMNFLAGYLLLVSGCDERLSYECLVQLLIDPKYLLYFLYAPQLPLVHLLTSFTNQMIFEKDMELFRQLHTCQIPDSFWLTKMLMSIFLYVFTVQKCLRLWDYFLTRGLIGIVELILGVMKELRAKILVSDLEEIGMMFQGQKVLKSSFNFDINFEMVVNSARTEFKISKKLVTQMTQIYLQNNLEDKKRSFEFEKIFLSFGNKQKFNEKIKQYMVDNKLLEL